MRHCFFFIIQTSDRICSVRFYVELVSVTYYISLYVGARRLVFHLSPRDVHVMIVRGCPILTAVNLIILIRMASITDRVVSSCASCGQFTKFCYQWFSAACESSAIKFSLAMGFKWFFVVGGYSIIGEQFALTFVGHHNNSESNKLD